MFRYGKLVPIMVLLGAIVLGTATPGRADFQLIILDDGKSVLGSPISGTPTTISYFGSTPDFSISGGFALTNSPGSNNMGSISITNLSVAGAVGHTLTLELSANGFTVPVPSVTQPFILSSSAALTTAGKDIAGQLTFQSYQSNSNNLFDMSGTTTGLQSSAIASGQLTNAQAFQNQSTYFIGQIPYSLTSVTTIQITSGGGETVGIQGQTAVTAPAPAGLVLSITGLPLLAVGGWIRRRKRLHYVL